MPRRGQALPLDELMAFHRLDEAGTCYYLPTYTDSHLGAAFAISQSLSSQSLPVLGEGDGARQNTG